MEDMEAESVVPEGPDVAPVEQEPLFSNLDLFLFSLIVGLLIYWFLSHKKTEEAIPEFKRLTTVVTPQRETSFIEKMKKTNRNMVVFYGSQTGTAEEFCGRLAKDAQRYGMSGMSADPEEYDMSELPRLTEIDNSLAVFCMATYGEGDPTDNAQDFYDWMQETDEDLNGVNFAVFGLGNKTYEHFNAMGKYTDKRLEELGGKRIYDLGMGDDDGNLEEDFVSWKEQLWPAVCEHFGVEATGDDTSIRQYELVVPTDINMNKVYTGEMGRLKSFETQKPYDSGDHVAVYPVNDVSIVNRIGQILDADLDTVISLNNLDEESNKKHPFPCPTTYRTALTHYLDITNTPRTNVLFELAQYATDPKDQDILRKMASASPEGKRNILAVLEDMPSLHPTIDHLCELLPRLQARYYSIASSGKVYSTMVSICAMVVEFQTSTGRSFKGVATNWLKDKVVVTDNGHKATVPMYVRKSQFRLPFKASNPVVMIGPGTGIAPFMGFLQERGWMKEQGKDVGETILYFGCRHRNEDFLYQQELEEFEKVGVLTQLNVAFSRDQEEKNSFYDIVEEVGGLTHTQAVAYIKKLMTKGRYSQDVWS
ncbi:unnamed protein product [Coregonus sp. 'balchen']|nr:unnamed protein product [Coregonus sp. 'balchen']